MKLPTYDQVKAFGRHAVTAAAASVGTLAAVHLISGGDASTLTGYINQINDGVAKIVAGVTGIITIGSGLYAAWSASPLSQLFAVAKQAMDPSSPVKGVILSDTPAGKQLASEAPATVVAAGSTDAAQLAKSGT